MPEDALGDVAAAELEEFFRWAFEATVRELLPRLCPVKRATKETAFLRSGGRRIQLDVDAFGVNEERKFAVLAEAKWARRTQTKSSPSYAPPPRSSSPAAGK